MMTLRNSRWILLAALVFVGAHTEAYRFESHFKTMVQNQWYLEALEKGALPLAQWNQPIEKGKVTSCYGPRKLLGKFFDFHHGVDYGVPVNTPVHAVADGEVIWKGNAGCAGRSVIVRHNVGDSLVAYSFYRHLRDYKIQRGQAVQSGQMIALSGFSGTRLYRNQKMGRRGCITAPHLHFEVRVLKPDVPSVMIDDAFVKRKGKINDALYPSNPVSFVPDLRDRCS